MSGRQNARKGVVPESLLYPEKKIAMLDVILKTA